MEFFIATAEIYAAVAMLSCGYRAVKIVELKTEHDRARSKDSKNLRLQLARHHMTQLSACLLWPLHVKDLVASIKWVKEVRE